MVFTRTFGANCTYIVTSFADSIKMVTRLYFYFKYWITQCMHAVTLRGRNKMNLRVNDIV